MKRKIKNTILFALKKNHKPHKLNLNAVICVTNKQLEEHQIFCEMFKRGVYACVG